MMKFFNSAQKKNHFVHIKNDQLSHTWWQKRLRDKKASVLFNPVENNVNQGIFVKRAFRDFNKTEKNREHAQTQYHNEAILRAQEFVKTYEHPTTHVDHDVNK